MTDTKAMPKTWNAIVMNFQGASNRTLREKIFKIAQSGGDVTTLTRTIGFSNTDLAKNKLTEIQRVANLER